MGRYDAAWGEEEHAEHEALIRDVLTKAEGNADRATLYRQGVEGAIQAHRPWARDIESRVLHNGYLAFWKERSREGVVAVVRGGRRFRKPKTWALPRVAEDGKVYTQDVLIETFTREDLERKRDESLRMRQSYDDTVQMYDALIAFLDAAGADDIPTAEAILGVPVSEWLEGAAA